MPSNFKSLLNNRTKQFDKLNDELTKINNKGGKKDIDERFWKMSVDKDGNGFAIIRFLPAPPGEGEDMPFVRYWEYGFKGPGGWYIEKSRKSISNEESDPVYDYNGDLYSQGTDAAKEEAKKQRRNLHFVSNILVVKDPANPENEGKVFLYRYGKSIYDMWNDVLTPEAALGEEPLNVFDPIDGANFRLKAYNNAAGYRRYDKSSFDRPSPLADDEEKMEKIWEAAFPLKPIIAPSEFKSYEELQKRLMKVLKLDAPKSKEPEKEQKPDEDLEGDFVPENFNQRQADAAPKEEKGTPEPSALESSGDEDDGMGFFDDIDMD